MAAFGLVRAAAAADMLQSASTQGPFALEVIGTSALYAGQSVLMFGFAAAAIEVTAARGQVRRVLMSNTHACSCKVEFLCALVALDRQLNSLSTYLAQAINYFEPLSSGLLHPLSLAGFVPARLYQEDR